MQIQPLFDKNMKQPADIGQAKLGSCHTFKLLDDGSIWGWTNCKNLT